MEGEVYETMPRSLVDWLKQIYVSIWKFPPMHSPTLNYLYDQDAIHPFYNPCMKSQRCPQKGLRWSKVCFCHRRFPLVWLGDGQLEDTLHQEREQADQLAHQVQERDTWVSELEQEQQFANDNITRLEQNLHRRDEELTQYTRRVVERESEVERLREEMSKLKREHSHLLNEQTGVLQDVTGQLDQTKARMDELIRVKAESDVELKTSRDRVTAQATDPLAPAAERW